LGGLSAVPPHYERHIHEKQDLTFTDVYDIA